MSEIQLISPAGSDSAISIRNATRFKKFFDDDIVIEPNSKIFLNHAIFSKHESVVFSEDEIFTLTYVQADTYGSFVAPTQSFTITEGVYTYSQLQEKIVEGLNTCLPNAAYDVFDEQNPDSEEGFIGFEPTKDTTVIDTIAAAPISLDVAFDADTLTISQNVADAAEFTSFFMGQDPYFHGSVMTQKPIDAQTHPVTRFSLREGDFSLTLDDLLNEATSPKIAIGFYGKSYALDDTVGDGSRTDETAIELVSDGVLNVPTMFFEAVIRRKAVPGGGGVNGIYMDFMIAQDTNTPQGTIKGWTDQKFQINRMSPITNGVRLDDGSIDLHESLKFDVYTYQLGWESTFETQARTYFAVDYVGGNQRIKLFDSYDSAEYAPLAFFTELGSGTAVFKESQLPFYPCFSTNINQFGTTIRFAKVANDSFIVRKLTYSATRELAKAIGLKDGARTIYPNPAQPEEYDNQVAIPSTFEDFYRMESYAIRLNNIPIQAYKTNETKGNRGYKQNILAVIPTPFQQADRESRVNIDGQDYLSTTYNSYYPMPKDMKNQRLVVNHFDVEVIRLSDDTQALDLNQVALNFSIVPPS
jgi:hypothetical protein